MHVAPWASQKHTHLTENFHNLSSYKAKNKKSMKNAVLSRNKKKKKSNA